MITVRVRVPFATIQLHLNVDDGTRRRWIMILFGVISDVTVNKVGYKMYDDVDDSYNLEYHQFILEMY